MSSVLSSAMGVTPTGVTPLGGGIRTDYGTVLPSAGNVVAYVSSAGVQALNPPDINSKITLTLNQALARCRASRGDIVMIMPGHAEDISAADQMSNLVAGTRIIGMGDGSLRGTFTWTAAAATFLLDVANVTLENLVLKVASTGNAGVTVVAPITVSAAGCRILDCFIHIDGDANDLATIPVTTTAAADDFIFQGNTCVGPVAAECTTFLRLVGADRCRIIGNYISAASSDETVGVIQALTTASLDILIAGNYLANNIAASEEALTLMAGCTGLLDENRLAVLDNASIALDNDGDCTYGPENTLANTVGERGVVLGTVSAAT